MDAVQHLGNIDIVRLRDVAGLPTWVHDLTLVAFKPDSNGDDQREPSIFVVEETGRAAELPRLSRPSRMTFIPDRAGENDPFIRGLLLAADKIRSVE